MVLVCSSILCSLLMVVCAGDVGEKKDQADRQQNGVSCYGWRELTRFPVIESLAGRSRWPSARVNTSDWMTFKQVAQVYPSLICGKPFLSGRCHENEGLPGTKRQAPTV